MAEILILRFLVLVGAAIAVYYLYKFVTAPEKENKEEVRLLKQVIDASKTREGRVTPADISFSIGLTLHEADKLLTKLVAEGLATVEVDDNGSLVYDIPRARDKQIKTSRHFTDIEEGPLTLAKVQRMKRRLKEEE